MLRGDRSELHFYSPFTSWSPALIEVLKHEDSPIGSDLPGGTLSGCWNCEDTFEDNLGELFGWCHKGWDGAQGLTSEDDPSSFAYCASRLGPLALVLLMIPKIPPLINFALNLLNLKSFDHYTTSEDVMIKRRVPHMDPNCIHKLCNYRVASQWLGH